MPFNNSSLFRLAGASWVRLLAITLGVLLAATVAALLGALVFVVVSMRVPAVLPVGGLISCLLLMTQVEWAVWRLGLPFLVVAALLAGLAAWRRRRAREHTGADAA